MLAASEYSTVFLLILLATITALGILVLSALVNPKRVGPRKHSTYESGMQPVGDTRRRFDVKFYVIAVLFLIFDVELLFFYPWALIVFGLNAPAGPEQQIWAQAMRDAGYTPAFLVGGIGVFFALLLVGLVYEWRRGVFKWN